MLKKFFIKLKNKLKQLLFGSVVVAVAVGATTAPVLPADSVAWYYSQGVPLFDTNSGELEVGQYAVSQNRRQLFVNVDGRMFDLREYPNPNVQLEELEEVQHIGIKYYDVFKNGEKIQITEKNYKDLAKEKNSRRIVEPLEKRKPLIDVPVAEAAISVASSTRVDSSYTNSLTFSVDCTGTNMGLVSAIANRNLSEITGSTYNGTSMNNEVQSTNTFVTGVRLYSLEAPSSGTNNQVVSLSDFRLLSVYSACLENTDQTDLVEATTSVATSFTSAIQGTTTSLTNNAWIMSGINLQRDYALTPDSGETELTDADNPDANLGRFGVSYVEKATAGAEQMGWSWSTAENQAMIVWAVKPAAAADRRIMRTFLGN